MSDQPTSPQRRISALPSAGTLTGSEVFPVLRAGATYKTNTAALAALAPAGPPGAAGVGITGASVDGGVLNLALSNGSSIAAGFVLGPQGPSGSAGPAGSAADFAPDVRAMDGSQSTVEFDVTGFKAFTFYAASVTTELDAGGLLFSVRRDGTYTDFLSISADMLTSAGGAMLLGLTFNNGTATSPAAAWGVLPDNSSVFAPMGGAGAIDRVKIRHVKAGQDPATTTHFLDGQFVIQRLA